MPLTLKQRIEAQAEGNFRKQLAQRLTDGETIKAGDYCLYTDGYTVKDRKVKVKDLERAEEIRKGLN